MYNNRSEAYYLSDIEERVAYVNNLWSKLTAYDNFNRSSIFVTSINLLNNALMCFEYGLYLSSVLSCRVVIESALYAATSNENMKVIRPPPAAIGSHEYIGSYNSTKRAHLLIDLSFGGLKNESLRTKFNKKKSNADIDRLRNILSFKLKEMIRINNMRMDYQEKFQKLIDDYKAGSLNQEHFFEELIKFSNSLEVEDRRALVEGLTEEELALFDKLEKNLNSQGKKNNSSRILLRYY